MIKTLDKVLEVILEHQKIVVTILRNEILILKSNN